MLNSLLVVPVASVLVLGCLSGVTQVRNAEELGSRVLLAGRVELFDNDKPVPCTDSGLRLMLFRDGDKKAKALEPDADCNVFVPVSEGRYIFGNVYRKSLVWGTGAVHLDPMPAVDITSADRVVNFCVVEVRFHQSAGSKTGALLSGFGRFHVQVGQRQDCQDIRTSIASRFAQDDGAIRDAALVYYHRAK